MIGFIAQIFITISLLIGLIICIRGMSTRYVVYKGGFIFFILLLFGNAYSWFMQLVGYRMIEKMAAEGKGTMGVWIYYSSLPLPIIQALAFLVLIIALYKHLIFIKNFNNVQPNAEDREG